MRVLKWGGIALLLLLVVIGAVAVYLVLDSELLRQRAAGAIGAALGREVTLGELEIDPGWVTDVVLRDLRIANPDWAEAPAAATVGTARLRFEPWSLLWGRTRIDRLEVSDADVAVERDRQGRFNWDVRKPGEIAGEVAKPEERSELPEFGVVRIAGIALQIVDHAANLRASGVLAAETAADDPQIRISFDGRLQDQPLRIAFVGGPLDTLRAAGEPYPVSLRLEQGETLATAEGRIGEPVRLRGLDLRLSLRGPDLAELLAGLHLPLPKTPPYRLSGHVTRDGDAWRIAAIEGAVGESDVIGDIRVDASAETPLVSGALRSKQLRIDDLGGMAGGATRPEEKAQGKPFTDTPIDLERLRTANLDIRLEAKRLVAPELPVSDLAARFRIEDGRLQVAPLRLSSTGGGAVEGSVVLDGSGDVPVLGLDLVLRSVDLRPFFAGTQFVQETGGRFSGRAVLDGRGRTPREVMNSADGQAIVAMREGQLSGLIIEAAGLDVIEALALVVQDDTPVAVRCARFDVLVEDGVARAREAVIDTTDSTLVAAGTVDLAAARLQVQIEAHPKDFSLIDATAPVVVSGPWTEPSFAVGGVDPLPFFEMGEQRDLDCDALVAGAVAKPEKAAPKR